MDLQVDPDGEGRSEGIYKRTEKKELKGVILKSTHKEKCFQSRIKFALLKLEWTPHKNWKLNFQKMASILTLYFLLFTSPSAAGRESGHRLLSH